MTSLPDTPAGRQAAWFVERLGEELDDVEIHARFAPAFLAAVPPAQVRAVTKSLGRLRPVTVAGAEGGARDLHVTLDGPDGRFGIDVAVEEAEPQRIVGLLVRPEGPTIADVLADPPPREDARALLDEHFGAYARGLGEHAGVACAVRTRGATTVVAYGSVADDAIFEIGSITKAITATLLADMAADGTVAVGDPVQRYLPAGVVVPEPEGGSITLLELATHTSGLPRLPVNLDRLDESDPYAGFTLDALWDGLAATQVAARGVVAYSNLGYALLGQALARAGGARYEDLATRRVLEPAGMVSARFGPDRALASRVVPGHAGGDVVPHWNLSAMAPAGGVRTDVRDVLAFGAWHASAEPGSAAWVTHETRARQGNIRVGLAWIVEQPSYGEVLWHNGGTGGFRSTLLFHPATGTVVAALANARTAAGPDAPAAAVLGALAAAAARG